jgi:hypothetical protein
MLDRPDDQKPEATLMTALGQQFMWQSAERGSRASDVWLNAYRRWPTSIGCLLLSLPSCRGRHAEQESEITLHHLEHQNEILVAIIENIGLDIRQVPAQASR